MRPVKRGEIPKNSDEKSIYFKKHGDAKPELMDRRIGRYCSYCEIPLSPDSAVAIEHMLPKDFFPDETLDWENFLLSCTSCNSNKKWVMESKWKTEWQYLPNLHNRISAKIAARSQYYWADRDNTFRAIEYLDDGRTQVHSALTEPEEQLTASATIDLVKLGRINREDNPRKNLDERYLKRLAVWNVAKESLQDLVKDPSETVKKYIVETAKGKGFFSVWMTVFKDDPDMLRLFIEAFPGTCQDCFDCNCNPILRPNGNL